MTKWISVKDRLPDVLKNPYGWDAQFFAWDGKEVFICYWFKIDCDYEDKYASSNGCWFGYIDGTECYSAHKNISHWMPIAFPDPPDPCQDLFDSMNKQMINSINEGFKNLCSEKS